MVILPNAIGGLFGQNTGMLKDILARIDRRLQELGLNESQAAKMAGLGVDGIRNARRRIESGKEDAGVSSTTLAKLAPVLQTTAGWLIDGSGPEQMPNEKLRMVLIEASTFPIEIQERIADFANFQMSNQQRRETAA